MLAAMMTELTRLYESTKFLLVGFRWVISFQCVAAPPVYLHPFSMGGATVTRYVHERQVAGDEAILSRVLVGLTVCQSYSAEK